MTIGLVRGSIFQEHDPGSWHPESPSRLVAVEEALQSWPGLAKSQDIPLRPAKEDELQLVHAPSHIARIASTRGRCVSLDPDTATSPCSFEAALKGVGSLIDLCDAALSGDVDHGLALVRPPGHHATPSRAMGFCLFNNVALAAAHLMVKRRLARILIVDWDVHHGNGTEDTFYSEDRVLYFSIHQSPFYPGSGPVRALGSGPAAGFNVNVPISGGRGDGHYLRIFQDLLVPMARQFEPQFILVSAGFDAHHDDPLGGMRLTRAGYAGMTRVLRELSEEFCPGRIVLSLEGGYSPGALGRSLISVLDVLTGPSPNQAAPFEETERPRGLDAALEAAGRYWDLV